MSRLPFVTMMIINMLDEVINTVQLSSLIMHKIGKKKTSCIGVVSVLLHSPAPSNPPPPSNYHVVTTLGIISPIKTYSRRGWGQKMQKHEGDTKEERLTKGNFACGWLQFSIIQKQIYIYIQYIHTNTSVNL